MSQLIRYDDATYKDMLMVLYAYHKDDVARFGKVERSILSKLYRDGPTSRHEMEDALQYHHETVKRACEVLEGAGYLQDAEGRRYRLCDSLIEELHRLATSRIGGGPW
jgi:DNA-binding MarR family transcriptional regulator